MILFKLAMSVIAIGVILTLAGHYWQSRWLFLAGIAAIVSAQACLLEFQHRLPRSGDGEVYVYWDK